MTSMTPCGPLKQKIQIILSEAVAGLISTMKTQVPASSGGDVVCCGVGMKWGRGRIPGSHSSLSVLWSDTRVQLLSTMLWSHTILDYPFPAHILLPRVRPRISLQVDYCL